jgi:hypothetical protein
LPPEVALDALPDQQQGVCVASVEAGVAEKEGPVGGQLACNGSAAYLIVAMNAYVTYWQSVLRDAERDLDAATVKSSVNAAGRKLLRARRELRALGVAWDEASPQDLST